jgi:hypothetical protein
LRRIGVLLPTVADDPDFQAWLGAFQQGLAQSGWIIGRNVRIDTCPSTRTPRLRPPTPGGLPSFSRNEARRYCGRLRRPSRRIQSKPASPRISAAIGAASDAQHPIRRLPARRSIRKKHGEIHLLCRRSWNGR